MLIQTAEEALCGEMIRGAGHMWGRRNTHVNDGRPGHRCKDYIKIDL
jgi:hypothetical protein